MQLLADSNKRTGLKKRRLAVLFSLLMWLGISCGSKNTDVVVAASNTNTTKATTEGMVNPKSNKTIAGATRAHAIMIKDAAETEDKASHKSVGREKGFSGASEKYVITSHRKRKGETGKPSKHTGYVNAKSGLNVREYPSENVGVIATLAYAEKISYCKTRFNRWYAIEIGNHKYGFISRKYVSNQYIKPTRTYQCSSSNRKPYMSWRAITSTGSKQYQLQARYGQTGKNGVRTACQRYCVAIGQAYNADVGTPVDVTLADGTEIPCVVGDLKKNCDTVGGSGLYGISNEAVEFIVETPQLPHAARTAGSLSEVPEWSTPVVQLEVYDTNIMQ